MNWNAAEKDDYSRERGVLTSADREYLCGESDIEEASHGERRARERIRNRVKNALLDFGILFDELEYRDLEQILMPENDAHRAHLASAEALAFILDGLNAVNLIQKPAKSSEAEDALKSAFEKIGRKRGYLVNDVEIDVDAEKIRKQALLRHLEEGNELSPEALRHLMELEQVDTEEVQEVIRSMVADKDD